MYLEGKQKLIQQHMYGVLIEREDKIEISEAERMELSYLANKVTAILCCDSMLV